MIANLSLQGAVERREQLLSDVRVALEETEQVIRKNPKDLDTAHTLELFTELRQINEQIEEKKREAEERPSGWFRRCFGNGAQKVTVGAIVITGLFWVAGTGLAIWNLTSSDEDRSGSQQCGGSDSGNGSSAAETAQAITKIAELLFLVVIWGGWNAISDEHDHYEITSKLSQIKRQGEDNFIQVFELLGEIKAKQEDAMEQKKALIKGIKKVDRLSQEGLGGPLSRDVLKSTMLRMLSEDHEITRKIQQLHATATISTPLQGSSEDVIPISTGDERKGSFTGEQMGFPSSEGAVRIREALDEKGEAGDEDIVSDREDPQLQYRRLWTELEEELGTRFCRLFVEGVEIDARGQVPPDYIALNLGNGSIQRDFEEYQTTL